MTRHPEPMPLPPAYRRAVEQLDTALQANTPSNNWEKIQILRLALFGELPALEKSEQIIIPD